MQSRILSRFLGSKKGCAFALLSGPTSALQLRCSQFLDGCDVCTSFHWEANAGSSGTFFRTANELDGGGRKIAGQGGFQRAVAENKASMETFVLDIQVGDDALALLDTK